MKPSTKMFIQIMGFYIVFSYLIVPAVFYFSMGRTLQAAGNGFAVGSILSIIMWYTKGNQLI
jgi:hypothetical protein